jgi:signal transduction histidine kinase
MDDATARSLFDASDDERGGGFGMPNSRRRLQDSGGDIMIEHTAPGKGTTFLLTIPHWTPTNGDTDA